MDAPLTYSVLTLAFGLGLLHAFDADHVMAVSGLASRRPGLRTSLLFCARWAVGHGLSLLAIGGAVLLLGLAIPERLSAMAEAAVGAVLIGIGLMVLWDLYRRRVHLHFHSHDELPQHAHWHVHAAADARRSRHRHDHSAVMVGLLHGTAGSAPLLALLPLAHSASPWAGLGYLALFGAGVLLAMLVFGGVLGGVFEGLMKCGERVVQGVRAAVAVGAVGLGAVLLGGSL